jgi:hypothetical protein
MEVFVSNAPSASTPPLKRRWTLGHTVVLTLIVLGLAASGLLGPGWGGNNLTIWLVTLALSTGAFAVAGHGVVGRWAGALIDDRNKMSLARLQMVIWSTVILSAFLTAGLHNVRVLLDSDQPFEPLAIALPGQLWMMMGISATAMIGSPLLKSLKKNRDADGAQRDRTMTALARQRGWPPEKAQERVFMSGQIVCNHDPGDAQVSDFFKGEEAGNAAQLDLARVQMFFFTIALAVVYAAALGGLFARGGGVINSFPEIHSSLAALLGISNAGYLAGKAVPNSQGQN